MLSRPKLVLLAVVALLAIVAPAFAQCSSCASGGCASGGCASGGCGSSCGSCCAPAPQYVERTVMCPVMCTENRTVKCVECVCETRTRPITCYECVPVTKTVQRCCTTMVPEERSCAQTYCVQVPTQRQVTQNYQVCVPTTRTETYQYTVCQPVWTDQVQNYTVMVPHCENRQATRCVCHMVPVTETRMVCEDQGHWEQRCCSNPCGCCESCCPRTYCCWVPNVVQKQIQVTCMKPETVQEPYTYQVTVCTPETRSCTVKVCHYENKVCTGTRQVCETHMENRSCTYTVTECHTEQRSREVKYTVCVPHTETRNEQVCCYETRAVQKTENYTVMVPHETEKVVQVQVCKMVPKTIQVPCCTTPCCDSCCRPRHHCRSCGC
jgi:hypothetical protein